MTTSTVATTTVETIPTTWTPADESFFRLVGDALPSSFLLGAGVLLASYDAEPAAATATTVDAVTARERLPGSAVSA